jgi:hypothetical protein
LIREAKRLGKHQAELLVIIKLTMQDRAPAMNRGLKASGSRRVELKRRANLAIETYELTIGASDSLYRRATEDPADNPLRKQAIVSQVTSAAVE